MLTDHDHDIDPALERKGADKPITPELSQRAGRTTDVSDNPLPVQSDRFELEKRIIQNLDLPVKQEEIRGSYLKKKNVFFFQSYREKTNG